MVMVFCVSVFVLSEHNMSIPARCQSRRESDEHGHTNYGSGHEKVQIGVVNFRVRKLMSKTTCTRVSLDMRKSLPSTSDIAMVPLSRPWTLSHLS